MFNDLTNPNQSTHPAVDDIFAETDKTTESGAHGLVGQTSPTASVNPINTAIDAHKVGLTAMTDVPETPAEKSGDNKWFKIIIIIVIVIIIILGGYLVYIKFLVGNSSTSVNPPNLPPTTPVATSVTPKTSISSVPVTSNSSSSAPATSGSLVATSSNTLTPSSGSTVNSATTTAPLIPGVNAPAIDSDSDGLPDVEEALYGTNPNAADTDSDGLSDYEEVKIYHTDPLNPDTDADGFSDGQEIKSGYNPLGAGKMSNASSTPAGN